MHQASSLALLALVASALALIRRSGWLRGNELKASVLIGLGLFVAPAVLTFFVLDWSSDLTRVALFSLVPMFAVIFEPYLGNPLKEQSKSGLMAALVAVAGSLLLFPIDLPQSVHACLAFGSVILATACIASANCYAVNTATTLKARSMAPFAAIAGASASCGLLVASAITEHSHWSWQLIRPGLSLCLVWTAAFELPALILLFWLMRHMSATRMTTRFLLAPLMANLFGFVFLRPEVSLREGLGLLLVASGAAWLLLANDDEPETSGAPLSIHFNK